MTMYPIVAGLNGHILYAADHVPTDEEKAAWVAILARGDARPTFETKAIPQRKRPHGGDVAPTPHT